MHEFDISSKTKVTIIAPFKNINFQLSQKA